MIETLGIAEHFFVGSLDQRRGIRDFALNFAFGNCNTQAAIGFIIGNSEFRGRKDIGVHLISCRRGRCVAEFHCIIQFFIHVGFERLELAIGEHFYRLKVLFHHKDGIALFPFGLFFPSAVGTRIRVGVAKIPIGLGFDQRGTLTAARAFGGFFHCPAHCQHIHAVHHFTGDAIGAGTAGDIRQLGDFLERHRHAIHIVFCNEDYRQIPDACHIERFVKGAFIGCAIAEEAYYHPVGSLQFLGECRTDSHRDVTPNNTGGSQIAMLHVGNMHGATLPLAVAAAFAQYFCHHFVVVVLFGIQCFGRLIAVCVGMTMPAMCARDQIIIA